MYLHSEVPLAHCVGLKCQTLFKFVCPVVNHKLFALGYFFTVQFRELSFFHKSFQKLSVVLRQLQVVSFLHWNVLRQLQVVSFLQWNIWKGQSYGCQKFKALVVNFHKFEISKFSKRCS